MSLKVATADEKRKIQKTFSFTGERGYEALEILKKSKEDGISQSTLIIELLMIYNMACKKYGYHAIPMLTQFVLDEKEIQKSK